jgi:hypothetical protein
MMLAGIPVMVDEVESITEDTVEFFIGFLKKLRGLHQLEYGSFAALTNFVRVSSDLHCEMSAYWGIEGRRH